MKFKMSASIRISDEKYKATKKATKKSKHCSIQEQVEFLAKLERCTIDNPDLPTEMIKELLVTDWKDLSDATPFTFCKND